MGRTSPDVGVDIVATSSTQDAPAAESLAEEWLGRPVLAVGALVGVVAVPLLVTLVVLHDPRWLALSDVAAVELTVRDVGSGRTPLVGVGSRMQGYGEWGNHPGPLIFYALAPVYRLFGSDGWALLVSAATLALTAAGLAVWIGFRRGGGQLALGVTAVVLVLFRAYGVEHVVEPWNPHLAVMWWLVFLLAVWSVLCRDHALLPVVVLAGSYCAQAHSLYLASVTGLGLLVAGVVAWRVWDGRALPAGQRISRRWLVGTGLLAALLWLPPLLDQLVHSPGNLAIIFESSRSPFEEQIAFGDAVERWLARLDLGTLVAGDLDGGDLGPGGSVRSGLVLLGAWGASAAVAWRRRDPALLALHQTVGVALGLGLLATTRIVGAPFAYLMLWAWATTALAVLAVVWTLLSSGRTSDAVPGGDATEAAGAAVAGLRRPRRSTPVLLGVTAVAGVLVVGQASAAEMPDAPLSRALGEMAPAVVDRLAEDPAGCGDDCTYLVTVADPVYVGSHVYGMLLELEKRGVDARVTPEAAHFVGDHRVVERAEADAVVHLTVTDAAAEGALADGPSEQLAYVDHDDGYEPSAVFLLIP